VAALHQPASYGYSSDTPVTSHETHISWIFLVGDNAYKVKKPVRTDFLDYTTLEQRARFCYEELRLDRRYADDLYVAVVPIVLVGGEFRIGGEGEPVEYAVKMRRFPPEAMLDHHLRTGAIPAEHLVALAHAIAQFHQSAPWKDGTGEAVGFQPSVHGVLTDAEDNLRALEQVADGDLLESLVDLRDWTEKTFTACRQQFAARITGKYIRECHGDLHAGNIVYWGNRLVPFDGIEFNEAFRWIDVLSDVAFLGMDLAAFGRVDLSHLFINAYLEHANDRGSLGLLRWYHVYRALVRAKVALIRVRQLETANGDSTAAQRDCYSHIELARRFAHPSAPRLWITHGLSGSGKTTLSEQLVRSTGAIRIRSDVERKRLLGLAPTEHPSGKIKERLYNAAMSDATYQRLCELACDIVRAGYSVVLDAAFLAGRDRERARRLADELGVQLSIVHCRADKATLRQRLAERAQSGVDASDADVQVLEQQFKSYEPLTDTELALVAEPPKACE
jgi:aminoglycoside phosphotransferase family enzyme/predicted kinase